MMWMIYPRAFEEPRREDFDTEEEYREEYEAYLNELDLQESEYMDEVLEELYQSTL